MKKLQKVCLAVAILFCIDYSITQLLGFSLAYNHIKDMPILHILYSFVVGVSGFICLLLFKQET